ncbi:VCBS repeat-containing protein [Flavihumibacter stibioxidans]|nr:VCBS repeat-containing protein [Flavihumibacter stibioxidans]
MENDSINILDLEYVYNGGGVAIADFNNDSLQDIYFTGNRVPNKLYLNEGGLKFRDVTDLSKTDGAGKWSTGVAAVDINNDGLMDLYVGASIKNDPKQRANTLYINKGPDANGVPVFVDEALAYNVADTGHTTNAAFFDYDNDGDLDLYVLTNKMDDVRYPNQYRKKVTDGSAENTDRLYRNDWDTAKGHPVFTNVSKEAGILIEGYGLGLNISDINQDGWKDIYVTNDFLSNDLVYINNRNGTFTNMADVYLKHSSYSAMGNDVADINNDGLMDIIAVDMLPASNHRKKMMMSANSYQNYLNNEEFGYQYQYVRNTLQLNQGNTITGKDSISHPVFSDIAFYAGIAETDWSWTPMVTDFDNDGWRDMIITNGYPKDITDRDFMTYRAEANKIASKDILLEQIPEVKLTNYAFRNNGDCRFTDVSLKWGLTDPTFSSGAAYGDLDNDGDLELVINNTNQEAMIYENRSVKPGKKGNHFLQIKFEGGPQNRNGLGAVAELYYDKGKKQVYDHTPYRGYLSSIQDIGHFGLGKLASLDSLIIKWPGGARQKLTGVKADQLLKVKFSEAEPVSAQTPAVLAVNTLFRDITDSLGLSLQQEEIDFSDFNIQKLLPHKLSEYGPGLAVGDIDGNGMDDLVMGGSYSYSPVMLLQQSNGMFVRKNILENAGAATKQWEDMGLLLFDADGDGDLDLYTASGSYETDPNSVHYQDKFYTNDGKGNFSMDTMAIPKNYVSKSCVRAADFDKDGDLDLFLAGRVEPWNYPKPVSSFIYRNDSKNGQAKFTDVTSSIAAGLSNIGLVCDAVWTDFDNDGWTDLMLAGEWMPLRFLKNEKGVFTDVSKLSGINNELGFWNSIAPGDYDSDGDMDYVVGNMGENSFYRATNLYPVRIYAKDFDNNNSFDAIPSMYLPDKEGNKKEFPAQTRDDLIKQIISLRTRFQNYNLFANSTMDQLITEEWRKDMLVVEANNMKSSLLRNDGKGVFTMTALPMQAQISQINGMVAEDFNGDGWLDLLMNGNDFGTEVSVGRYDALNGLFLQGDANGGFIPKPISESGIYIPGNGKSLVKLNSANGNTLIIAGQNRGPLKTFKWQKQSRQIPFLATDAFATMKLRNGKIRKQEAFYGSSFLSQSGRYLQVDDQVSEVLITNNQGTARKITF